MQVMKFELIVRKHLKWIWTENTWALKRSCNEVEDCFDELDIKQVAIVMKQSLIKARCLESSGATCTQEEIEERTEGIKHELDE